MLLVVYGAGHLRAPLANRSLHALARGLERRRLGRRRDARRRRRDRLSAPPPATDPIAWYVATGFEKHRLLDHGLWSLAAHDDRPRPCCRWSRRSRPSPPAGSAPPTEGRAFVDRRRLGVSSPSSPTPRSRARTSRPCSRLLIVERNVIYLVPIVFAATAAVLARADRDRPGARGRLPRRAAPRPQGRVQARPVPVLRGPEPGDRRAREPQLHLGRRGRRARARDRRAGLRRAARGALVRALADDRARGRRRRGAAR